ncbi:MAG: hypothetical protein ABEJ07_06335 [Candidatus Nanohaloarchaea archaeon]
MGRTNSTYRNHLDSFIESFRPFRKALRDTNQEHLDGLWEKAHSYAHAASYMNSSSPGIPAIISMLLGLQKESSENAEKITELEKRIQELEDGIQD